MSVATHGVAAKHVSFERDRGVYSITVTEGLAHCVVTVGSEPRKQANILSVFRKLSDKKIPVFLVKLHRSTITFAIESEQQEEAERLINELGLNISIRREVAIISVIASSMRELSGILVSIADSLQSAGARLIAVGDSHNSVQCLIDGRFLEAAVKELTDTFALDTSDPEKIGASQ